MSDSQNLYYTVTIMYMCDIRNTVYEINLRYIKL